MIVKKYIVNTVEEAQKQIMEELGPHAMILSSRHIRPKGAEALLFRSTVEIVASVDEENLRQFSLSKSQEDKPSASLREDFLKAIEDLLFLEGKQ